MSFNAVNTVIVKKKKLATPSAWKPGQSGNPKGRGTRRTEFLERVYWVVEHYTIEQARETVGDKKKFGKLAPFDGMVLIRMVEAVAAEGRLSMESLWDRILGKPIQYIESKDDITIGAKSISATSEWVGEIIGTRQAKPSKEPVPD